MKVWTLVTPEIFNRLQQGIPYRGENFLTPVWDFSKDSRPYSMLVEYMEATVGDAPTENPLPIWGFYCQHGSSEIPEDLEFDDFPDEASVLLILEIPDKEVLLSDASMWIDIVEDKFLPMSNNMEDLNAEYEAYIYADASWQEYLRETSWYQVFGFDEVDDIYAHFWEIRPDMIRSIRLLPKYEFFR